MPVPPMLPPNDRAPSIAPQSPWRAVLCWVVIGLCVAGIMWTTVLRKAAPKSDDAPSVQHVFQARYAAGAAEMGEQLSPGTAAGNTGRQLAAQMSRSAGTDRERLYAAILTAQLDSPETGRAKLNTLATEAASETVRTDAAFFARLFDPNADELSDDERAGLVDRHGWVARYALTRTSSAGSPDRAAVDRAARRTFIAAMSFGVVVLIAVVTGVVLLVIGCVFWATGTLRMANPTPAGRDVAMLEGFTLYLGLMTLGMTWAALQWPGQRAVLLPLALLGFALGLAWPMARRAPWFTKSEVRAALGLHRGRGFVAEAFFGVVGYIALLPLMVLGVLITVLLTRLSGADASHPLGEEMTGSPAKFLLLAAAAAVFAPVTEELLFRGALFGHLRARMAWPIAGAASALIFAAIHPQGWAGIPVVAMIGFNMAVIRQWRGSIIAPVVAHALNNGAIVLLMGIAIR